MSRAISRAPARAPARAIARRRHRTRARATTTTAEVDAFAREISGEWIGHCASFDPISGEPSSLPSSMVPDAFREWGMDIKDWQSQCSTTVRDAASGTELYCKDARFVPVVGCEADASTVESFERDAIAIERVAVEAGARGGYSACYEDQKGVEIVQHCVVNDALDPPIRVRMKHRADGCGAVRVWREAMDEPFCDGGSLASSCGGNSAVAKFAEYPRDAADVVARVDADFTLPTNATQLPVGIWFSIVVEEDGSYASQLGYADEKTASHVASARSRSGLDESSVVVRFHRALSP